METEPFTAELARRFEPRTKDFLGRDVVVGSHVIFMQKNYRNLMKGVVVRISDTGKTVWVSHDKTNVGETETKQDAHQVIGFTP
jgi:hypothetical protein